MAIKLTNNAASNLSGNITAADTSITILPGEGVLFPALAADDWFPATIVKATGEIEIIKVTARSTDTFTADHGQEGTIPRAFNAGDRIQNAGSGGSHNNVQPTLVTNFIVKT